MFNASGIVISILTVAFAAVALNSLIIGPMLATQAEFDTEVSNLSNVQSFGNISRNVTNNVTFVSGDVTGTLICPGDAIGFRWNIRIPLPILDQVSLTNVDFCPPPGYSGDFTSFGGSIVTQGILLLVIIISFALLGVVMGYITGGESGQSMASLGFVIGIGLVFISVMLSNIGFATIMPGQLGLAVFALVFVFGIFAIAMVAFGMLSGSSQG